MNKRIIPLLFTLSITGCSTNKNVVHHFSYQWSFDETTHWKECTDEGFKELKGEEQEHQYIDNIIAPTYTHEGFTRHTCKICHYSYTDSVTPKIELPYTTVLEYVKDINKKARIEAYKQYQKLVNENNLNSLYIPYSDDAFYVELKDFVEDLTENCTSDFMKAYTIFNWVSYNITYDSSYDLTTSMRTVFETRKGVCASYTWLMHDMLSIVNIPVFCVYGICRYMELSSDVNEFVNSYIDKGPNHAWLYFYINDEIICSDPTWKDWDITDDYLSDQRVVLLVEKEEIRLDI